MKPTQYTIFAMAGLLLSGCVVEPAYDRAVVRPNATVIYHDNDRDRDRDYDHDHDYRDDDRFCPPGQAKKGNC